MTRILYRHAIAALAAVAVFSCMQIQTDEFMKETVTLTFSSEKPLLECQSKTHWNGTQILWSEGDRISVTYKAGGTWAGALYPSDAVAGEGETAEFSVPLATPPVSTGSVRFHALYPSSAVENDFTSAPLVQVIIPSVQTPLLSSYDPSADLMVAQAVETYNKMPSAPVPLLWHRLVAHADITLIMPDIPEDEILRSVVITAGKATRMTGAYTLDLESWTMQPDESGQGSNAIVIKTDNLSVEGGRLNVWASICPCHISSLDIRIETDRHAYVKHVPSCDLTFKANVRGILSVDMSSAEAEYPPAVSEANIRRSSLAHRLLPMQQFHSAA